MIRVICIVLLVLVLMVVLATTAFAKTPNPNASHVAQCATLMGGQHVATCAQTMEKGISSCAQMSGPCNH